MIKKTLEFSVKTLKFLGKALLITVVVSPIVFMSARDSIFTLMNPGVETTFLLTGEITEKTSEDFKVFMDKNSGTLFPASAITVVISSQGGSVRAGGEIVDLIHLSRSRVNTVAKGVVASMAALIFVEGDKRTMTRSSILIFHETRVMIKNTDILDDDLFEMADNVEKVKKIIEDLSLLAVLGASQEKLLQDLLTEGSALFKSKGATKLEAIVTMLMESNGDAERVKGYLTTIGTFIKNTNIEAIDAINKKTGISFSILEALLNNNKDNFVSSDAALDLGIATEVR